MVRKIFGTKMEKIPVPSCQFELKCGRQKDHSEKLGEKTENDKSHGAIYP